MYTKPARKSCFVRRRTQALRQPHDSHDDNKVKVMLRKEQTSEDRDSGNS